MRCLFDDTSGIIAAVNSLWHAVHNDEGGSAMRKINACYEAIDYFAGSDAEDFVRSVANSIFAEVAMSEFRRAHLDDGGLEAAIVEEDPEGLGE